MKIEYKTEFISKHKMYHFSLLKQIRNQQQIDKDPEVTSHKRNLMKERQDVRYSNRMARIEKGLTLSYAR